MDDAELRDLLRDAPGETPPASFDVDAVRAAAWRARRRRRSIVTVASACAVVVLAGAAMFGIILATDGAGSTTAADRANSGGPGSNEENAAPGQPGIAQQRSSDATSDETFPGHSPKQGGDGSAEDGPRADSTDGCDKVDRKLANALADELPVTGAADDPKCSTDSHSVEFALEGGRITATYVEQTLPDSYTGPPGRITVTRQVTGGGAVLLVSIPTAEDGSAPLANELRRIATELARSL